MPVIDQPEVVLFEKEGGLVILTLNEQDTRNALSDEIVDRLLRHCAEINADDEVRCVILTGNGRSFSSGGNVKGMGKSSGSFGQKVAWVSRRHLQDGIQRLPKAFYELEVPVIAAVNGHAMGAGCDLALMCDIRIASENAVFSENFLQMGLVPGDGGAWLLPRVVGASRAAEMSFTCDRIDAATAAQIGLVSRVVPAETLMTEARAIAARIVDKPPQSLRLTKRLLRESMGMTLHGALELAASMQAIAQNTRDHVEAVMAFLEKRKPEFKGQ